MSFNYKFLSYILGKEASAEKASLAFWKNEAKANIDSLRSLSNPDDELDILKNYHDVDQDKAWLHIEEEMTPVRVLAFNRLGKIAAIMILVVGVVWGFVNMDNFNRDADIALVEYHGDTNSNVEYKDGSQIALDGHSHLKELDYRKFRLDGRAYFSVAKETQKAFTIETPHGEVIVLGTEFNVMSSSSITKVFVKHGQVKVRHEGKEYILNPDDYIELQKGSAILSNRPSVQPDIWKNKELRFENKSFRYVMESLSVYFNMELDWVEGLKIDDNCRINTVFKNQDLKSTIKELQLLTQFQYEIKSNKIIVRSYKC